MTNAIKNLRAIAALLSEQRSDAMDYHVKARGLLAAEARLRTYIDELEAQAGPSSAEPTEPFKTALEFVLEREGGFSDHPDDPGGATNLGVTQATYDAWRSGNGQRPRGVQSITYEEAAAIYEQNYWGEPCETLDWPLSLALFDARVQHGYAIGLLQRAVNGLRGRWLETDNAWGPKTRLAAEVQDPVALSAELIRQRLVYYGALDGDTFDKGWLSRMRALAYACGLR